jgi:hypothetical protein
MRQGPYICRCGNGIPSFIKRVSGFFLNPLKCQVQGKVIPTVREKNITGDISGSGCREK